ncbi:MAG: DUF4244 domain-containing protein [Actinomycetota bacterium]|nr:DUF4244 domain-containing protein [Actinomycetota bacterium]
MSPLTLFLLTACLRARFRLDRLVTGPIRRRADEGGQATAEYALVLLGAAAIALLLAAWAAKSGKIGQLFDAVVDQLIGKAG